jgi:hypothetical protein
MQQLFHAGRVVFYLKRLLNISGGFGAVLTKMVAAIPVMLTGCETNWTKFVDGPRTRPEYAIGSQFIEINGKHSFWLMTIARWACIPFSLIGGLCCFFWSRELYRSDISGLIAVTLWCFDPLILGNSELITNDVAAASFGLVACYYFWRWLKSPSWTNCIITGFDFDKTELNRGIS